MSSAILPSQIFLYVYRRFWTLYDTAINNPSRFGTRIEKIIRDLAASKLVNLQDPRKLASAPAPARFAVLDTLLNLNYDPRQSSTRELCDAMVASHMRTAFSVPVDRHSMYSGYPSEPILAEAALDILYQLSGEEISDPMAYLFEVLDKDSESGAIDHGERGENVGKMILLRAYMAAVMEDAGLPVSEDQGLPPWRNGCSLVSFLKHLTAKDFHDVALNCRPDNVPAGSGAPLDEAFKNAWVRFTHFARAADDSAMTTNMAWLAFTRGMAMIGWHSQIAVDVHIPVLLDKTAPIKEPNMSGILVQFKVREGPSNAAGVTMDADSKSLRYFPPAGSRRDSFPDSRRDVEKERVAYRTRPYISLVMELGVVQGPQKPAIRRQAVEFLDKAVRESKTKPNRPKSGKHDKKPSISKIKTTTPPTRKVANREVANSSTTVHPRYSLFFYGRSHKVYGCIVATDDAKYANLLKVRSLLDAHPLTRSLGPVLQMKPFWCTGVNAFDWVNEPYFNKSEPGDTITREDTVEDGKYDAEDMMDDVESDNEALGDDDDDVEMAVE